MFIKTYVCQTGNPSIPAEIRVEARLGNECSPGRILSQHSARWFGHMTSDARAEADHEAVALREAVLLDLLMP